MTRPLPGAIHSHGCGTLRAGDAGAEVRLAGWVARRRDHGGVAFLDLRDASGVVRVVVHPDQAQAAAIRAEDLVRVAGTVRARPAGNENPELPTGEVEVAAADTRCRPPPRPRRSRWRAASTPTRPCAPVPLPAEAMRRFGTDTPDLRYGMELVDLGPVFAGTPSIRDVITFPKTQSGADPPLTGAPRPSPGPAREVRRRPLDPPAAGQDRG
jgi:aspartyl-tRNA synthetase